jgi:uncharacterized sulfatase
VIFFSDNGGLISRFDKIPLVANSKKHIYENDSLLYIASSNAPLRAEKGTLYEGGIREPLIVKWPGQINPGTRSESIVSSVDFFPTLAEILQAASTQEMDGHSLMPDLEGKIRQDRAIYWHYPVYHHSQPASAVREGDLKLIYFYDEDRLELYNLSNDVGEKVNLASIRSDEAQRLKKKLDDWLQQTKADLPTINPDFDEQKRWEWGTHPGRDMLAKGE